MKKQVIDTTLLTQAHWTQTYADEILLVTQTSHHHAICQMAGKAASLMPALVDCFGSGTVPFNRSVMKSRDLFSAQGPLASKLLEHATLTYILNGAVQDFENSKLRIVELFDYSDLMLTGDLNYRSSKSPRYDLDDLKTYVHCVINVTDDINNRTDEAKRISFARSPRSSYYSSSYDWNLTFVNDIGAIVNVSSTSTNLEYKHPNENIASENPGFIFASDAALLGQVLEDFFVSKGFEYQSYVPYARRNVIQQLAKKLLEYGKHEVINSTNAIVFKKRDHSVRLNTYSVVSALSSVTGNMIAEIQIDNSTNLVLNSRYVRNEDGSESTTIELGVPSNYSSNSQWQYHFKSVIGEQLLLNKAEVILNELIAEQEKFAQTGWPDYSLLTKEEEVFVRKIFASPGVKLNSGEAFGEEEGESLWEKPLELGFIRTKGSYKWVPNTTKYHDQFNDGPGEGKIPPVEEAAEPTLKEKGQHD